MTGSGRGSKRKKEEKKKRTIGVCQILSCGSSLSVLYGFVTRGHGSRYTTVLAPDCIAYPATGMDRHLASTTAARLPCSKPTSQPPTVSIPSAAAVAACSKKKKHVCGSNHPLGVHPHSDFSSCRSSPPSSHCVTRCGPLAQRVSRDDHLLTRKPLYVVVRLPPSGFGPRWNTHVATFRQPLPLGSTMLKQLPQAFFVSAPLGPRPRPFSPPKPQASLPHEAPEQPPPQASSPPLPSEPQATLLVAALGPRQSLSHHYVTTRGTLTKFDSAFTSLPGKEVA